MTYRFSFAALLLMSSLAFTAQAGDHASSPQRQEPNAASHGSDAAAQRRKSALRAALLEQQAQGQQHPAGTTDAQRPLTAQDRAELRQQIRQQSRSNSRP